MKWPALVIVVGATLAVPGQDAGDLCADVGRLRACWQGDDIRLCERALPATAARSPMGWRCAGQGPTRTCVDRRDQAPAFSCEGDRCRQQHPRRPDDGEWSCGESAGATICRGGERAAGVAAGPADPGWLCGTSRPGAKALPIGPRVCVDFSPDFPDGEMTGWRCRTLSEPAPARECVREAAAVLTASCDRGHPCVDGSRCIAGRCLPRAPGPNCALDADCPGRRCRFGTCLPGDGPP